MKKGGIIWIFLAVLVGCEKHPLEGYSNVPLTFEAPAVGTQSKAVSGDMGVTYDISESFRVWGWLSFNDIQWSNFTTTGAFDGPLDGSEYFGNVKAIHGGKNYLKLDYWYLNPVYYWPKAPDARLAIHALSPYDVYSDTPAESDCTSIEHHWQNGSGQPVGFVVNGFTVKDNPADQYDLLYSDYTFNAKRANYTGDPYDEPPVIQPDPENPTLPDPDKPYVYNGINLLFNHALSSVQIKVKQDKDYEIEGSRIRFFLTNVELRNAYKTGTFYENRSASANVASAPNAYASPIGRAYWTSQSNAMDRFKLYSKGALYLKEGGDWVEQHTDVPMITNGEIHVARNVKIERGLEIVFRKDQAWDDIRGHIKGTVPYEHGERFDVSPTGTDINILNDGIYDILLDPTNNHARITSPQSDEAYADYTATVRWFIHHTPGYRVFKEAYGLKELDPYGNYYVGGENLLIIPQPLRHSGSGEDDVNLYVEYTIKYGDVDVPMSFNQSLYGLGDIEEWIPGKRYVYTITFSMDKVSLKPAVTGWVSEGLITE